MTALHHPHSSTVRLAVGWMSPLHNFKHYQGWSTLYANIYVNKELHQQLLGNSTL